MNDKLGPSGDVDGPDLLLVQVRRILTEGGDRARKAVEIERVRACFLWWRHWHQPHRRRHERIGTRC